MVWASVSIECACVLNWMGLLLLCFAGITALPTALLEWNDVYGHCVCLYVCVCVRSHWSISQHERIAWQPLPSCTHILMLMVCPCSWFPTRMCYRRWLLLPGHGHLSCNRGIYNYLSLKQKCIQLCYTRSGYLLTCLSFIT